MWKLKMARTGYFVMSLVFYMIGIFCIAPINVSSHSICIASGIILLIYGIIKIIGYFSKDQYCLAFQYDLACGLFLIVLGIIILAFRQQVMPYLSVGLGILVLMDSLLSLQMSKDAKQFGLESWWIILIAAIIAGVFGVLTMIEPYISRFARRVVICGTLLAEGFKSQCVVHYTVSTMRTHFPVGKSDDD